MFKCMLVMEQSYTINYKIRSYCPISSECLDACVLHTCYYSPISLQCLEAGMFSGYEYHSIANE